MNIDFNKILPLACQWVEEQERLILNKGVPLSEEFLIYASKVGVNHPDRIRILSVNPIPIPENPILKEACNQTQLISSFTAGLTLRYGIFVRSDFFHDRRLYVHELVHVAQYERLGGIQQFLQQYLYEVLTIGYPEAPMEQEAIKVEGLKVK